MSNNCIKETKKIIIIAGPTAVGKTNYSIELAKKINGEIVSADSIQVYKGLDIGSAKITKSEMQNIKHHLIDVVDFSYNFDIATFCDYAKKAIEEIYEKGKTPIIVGGTGFYIHALLYNTYFEDEDEKKKESIRKELYELKQTKGIEYIYNKLKQVDEESYNNIHMNNEKRVLRALEYYMLHNEKISTHNKNELEKESEYDYKFIVLTMPRDILYSRINKRIDIMLEQGLTFEIATLINLGCKKEYRSMQAIGYKELYDFVNDNLNLFLLKHKLKTINSKYEIEFDVNNKNKNFTIDEYNKLEGLYNSKEFSNIVESIKKNSRNFAKRQDTWFRREKNVEYREAKY